MHVVLLCKSDDVQRTVKLDARLNKHSCTFWKLNILPLPVCGLNRYSTNMDDSCVVRPVVVVAGRRGLASCVSVALIRMLNRNNDLQNSSNTFLRVLE